MSNFYCIKSFNSYVAHLTFADDGVKMQFSTSIKQAAKVSVKESAEHLAKLVPDGKVIVWRSIFKDD